MSACPTVPATADGEMYKTRRSDFSTGNVELISVHGFVLDGDLSRQEMGLWRRVCEAAGPDVAAFDPHAVSTPPPGATPSVGLTLSRR